MGWAWLNLATIATVPEKAFAVSMYVWTSHHLKWNSCIYLQKCSSVPPPNETSTAWGTENSLNPRGVLLHPKHLTYRDAHESSGLFASLNVPLYTTRKVHLMEKSCALTWEPLRGSLHPWHSSQKDQRPYPWGFPQNAPCPHLWGSSWKASCPRGSSRK